MKIFIGVALIVLVAHFDMQFPIKFPPFYIPYWAFIVLFILGTIDEYIINDRLRKIEKYLKELIEIQKKQNNDLKSDLTKGFY